LFLDFVDFLFSSIQAIFLNLFNDSRKDNNFLSTWFGYDIIEVSPMIKTTVFYLLTALCLGVFDEGDSIRAGDESK
jgi:hypothetical protein